MTPFEFYVDGGRLFYKYMGGETKEEFKALMNAFLMLKEVDKEHICHMVISLKTVVFATLCTADFDTKYEVMKDAHMIDDMLHSDTYKQLKEE